MNERSLVIITNKNFSKTNDSSLELKDFLEKLNDKKQILDKNDDSIRQKLSRKIKVINFKNIDEFEKNACSIINETGLILYDISVDISPGKRGILENLNDTIKNCLSDESLIKYPPVGFIADKFRIKILEEQVISPDYPKFIGIFSYGGLYDHSFISLIDNFLNLSIDDLKTSKIGETCKTEIDTAEELTTFFNKRKFSSLFIGKNREELLRLRTELINKKDSLISWRNSPLVEEIKNNSDFLKDFYKNLTPGKDFNDDEISIFKKNDDEKWSGFSILILGDTGTGKTLVSEWISSFIGMLVSENNNIAVNQFNCANLTEELFDSGFFGILKGQATSVESRYGKILESIGKVMFLDEVAELLPQCQSKLLIYLQEFKMRPEGYDKGDFYVPNFLVAATNQDIQPKSEKDSGRPEEGADEIKKEKKFREDLYHRFKFVIKLLPLKERREDLEILIDYVLQDPNINKLKHENKDAHVEYLITHIETKAVECLKQYDYPGNFRELEKILRDAANKAIFYNSNVILFDHLPEYIKSYCNAD